MPKRASHLRLEVSSEGVGLSVKDDRGTGVDERAQDLQGFPPCSMIRAMRPGRPIAVGEEVAWWSTT